MFKSIELKNFRGFKDFSINSLERINLIAGKNNVGKTALLEAIFLLLGATNSRLTWQLNVWRGIDNIKLDSREIWGWLFYNRNADKPIEISCTDNDKILHQLVLKLVSPSTIKFNPQEQSGSGVKSGGLVGSAEVTANVNRILELNYSNSKGIKLQTQAEITNNEIKLGQPTTIPFPLSSYIPSGVPITTRENAERFSMLKTFGKHVQIIETLKVIEPRLVDIDLLFSGEPSFGVDIGSDQLLPISYMGDGINRLLNISLAIATAKDGAVLIDEIENGFHHSIMEKIWNSIQILAHKNNTQIFATTHSWECIQAAHSASLAEKDQYDFRLYRLDRINNEIKTVAYDEKTLSTSFDLNWEVR